MPAKKTSGVVDKPEIKEFNKELTVVQKHMAALKVTNEEGYKDAAAIKKELTTQISKIKAFFKPMEDDAKRVLDTIRGQKKMLLDPREEAKTTLVQQMAKYQLKREEAREKAETKAIETGSSMPVKAKGAVKAAGVGTSFTWELDHDNINIDKVPREYLMLDERKVLAAIKAKDGDITIDGIAFKKKAIIR